MKNRPVLVTTTLLVAGLAWLGAGVLSADPAPVPMPMGDKDKTRAPSLKKHKPVACDGTRDISLDKVLIESEDSPAVVVLGSCDVVIKDSVIKGSGPLVVVQGSGDIKLVSTTVESTATALVIQGSGEIEVTGSHVTGKVAALIEGSGDLIAKDTVFHGKKVVSGTGEYKDRGGNKWQKK